MYLAMVNAAVIGARGYLGRELVRLLLAHPHIDGIIPVTTGASGGTFGEALPSFRHRRDLVMANAGDAAVRDATVAFLATDNDESKRQAALLDNPLIIDLSRAHRHDALAGVASPTGTWTYGMSEFVNVAKGTSRIANPGCYPTATMVAAAAALANGLATAGPLISDGKSGVSGAGATPRADIHFAEANESVRAYKVIGHDHSEEIRLMAGRIEGAQAPRPVRFTPHLVPQNRGLLATVYIPVQGGVTSTQARDVYQRAYAAHPFVRVVSEPDTATVRGSNFADVAVDVDTEAGLLVARCAIDNLVKGGSGAAIQNMNLALGFAPTAGLEAIGGGP